MTPFITGGTSRGFWTLSPEPIHLSRRCRSATIDAVGKIITRLRPGDRQLNDRAFAEAHRLFESGVPASEAISTLIEIAGDNPNAFMTGKNARGLNKTLEGRAIFRLIGTASQVRDHSGLPIGSGWWPPGD